MIAIFLSLIKIKVRLQALQVLQNLSTCPALSYYVLVILGVIPFINVGPFSGTWSKVTGKLQSYSVISGSVAKKSISSNSEYNLNFKDVKTTIREASEIPPDVVRNRILADSPSCSCHGCLANKDKKDAFIIPTAFFGFIGMFLLIIRYWEMCLTCHLLQSLIIVFQGQLVCDLLFMLEMLLPWD